MHGQKIILTSCVALSLYSTVGCRLRSFNKLSSDERRADTVAEKIKTKFGSAVRTGLLPNHSELSLAPWIKQSFPFGLGVLPRDHVATIHLQQFVNRIHSQVVTRFPEAAALAAPRLEVIIGEDINAFQLNGAYCLPIMVKANDDNSETSSSGSLLSVSGGYFLGPERTILRECPEWAPQKPELVDALIKQNNQLQPECKLQRQGTHLRVEKTCVSKVLPAGRHADGVKVTSAAGVILVYTGLLKNSEEKHAEAVIAHELAHYYLAHAVFNDQPDIHKQNLNYFFRVGEYRERTKRPEKDTSKDIVGMAFELTRQKSEIEYVIPGQTLRPSIIRSVSRVAQSFQEFTSLIRPGQTVNLARTCQSLNDTLAELTKTTLTHEGAQRWERNSVAAARAATDARACLESISTETLFAWKAAAAQANKQKAYDDFIFQVLLQSRLVGSAINPSDTLKDLLNKANAKLLEEESKRRDIATRAQTLGLGYYTSESEADELSVYLLALAGRHPGAVAETFFVLQAETDDGQTEDDAFAPNLATCRKAYLNSWRDWRFNNKPWVPFFGKTNKIHPSHCFRVFNADQESQPLLPLFSGTLPANSSAQWREIQRQLDKK